MTDTKPTLDLDYTNACVLMDLTAKHLGIVPADYQTGLYAKPPQEITDWLERNKGHNNAFSKMLRVSYNAILYYDAQRAFQTAEMNLQAALR